ncbi:guanine nucleotide-binding protein g(o) subunit alpha [Anaeramoeba flamelloides]|uniref:Guanine nucleotide-binding protein g(O) subunit alpha n=1 Tax=Anaeramoeba flamelloides TaxID=1746091 RepID=A0AAV7YKE0_9EUKA|nr:guanine nucleotide-binding protein g(o) subunit alpha [Anaeramoeba flamelloides]KAJ6254128.1 guanine nucleotide-binding protein g(o) subunit alpha [Anaeramoeba flamelloides]
MGNCVKGSNVEGSASKKIDRKLKRHKVVIENEISLLLLGTGDSGKSTFVKQMRLIGGMSFDQDERDEFVDIIRFNVIQNTRTLVFGMERVNENYQSENNLKNSDYFKNISPTNSEWNESVYNRIKEIWNDEGIQQAFNRGSEFHLNDTSQYYFEKIDIIARNDYIPTDQDIICSRIKTTGIAEIQFEMDDFSFRVLDVGGQRNERKKWIHCFEGLHALIFCTAISEYDQVLYEDENQNRMTESLHLFDEICNMKWFERSSILLFLNKIDIFKEKINKIKLQNYFPNYNGNNYDEATGYIKEKFLERNKNVNKRIYTFFTCATDSTHFKQVFEATRDSILSDLIRDID